MKVASISNSLCVDLIFEGLESIPALNQEVWCRDLVLSPGGGLNFAIGLSRLGIEAYPCGSLGRDPFGLFLEQELRKEGVHFDFLSLRSDYKTAVSVALPLRGDRAFISYRDPADPLDFKPLLTRLAAMDHIHCSRFNPELIRCLRRLNCSVSLAVGYWADFRGYLDLLDGIDILSVSASEALAITGEASVPAALHTLAQRVRIPLITRDAEGSLTVDENGKVLVAPSISVTAKDATGAGDVFLAGFLRGWLAHLPLQTCLELGNVCGALTTTDFGIRAAPTFEAACAQVEKHYQHSVQRA